MKPNLIDRINSSLKEGHPFRSVSKFSSPKAVIGPKLKLNVEKEDSEGSYVGGFHLVVDNTEQTDSGNDVIFSTGIWRGGSGPANHIGENEELDVSLKKLESHIGAQAVAIVSNALKSAAPGSSETVSLPLTIDEMKDKGGTFYVKVNGASSPFELPHHSYDVLDWIDAHKNKRWSDMYRHRVREIEDDSKF